MNIVLINFDSVANSYSGTARVFANMANNLASKGHNVTGLSYELRQGKAAFSINPKVCLRNCCSNLYEKIFHNDALAKLRTFYISNRKDRRIRRVRLELQNKSSSIKKALDDASPDVIIAFQQEITYLLMEILHVQHPIITMVHNKPSFYFEKPEFEIYKPCLDRCACVQVLMPQYVKEAQLFLDQKNIVYIPNVVPQYPEFNSKKKNVILNIAKIAARKRQHLIVEAFSMIANKYPDWIVELWGWDQSEYAEKLRKQIKSLGLESKVKLCGETKQVTQKLQEASGHIPIFKASNMSFDIYLMGELVSQVASILSDTDIEITETHHNRKIDSPSGTALFLADKIKEARPDLVYNFSRMAQRKKREPNEIGFSSIRGGNIVGEHTVQFFGPNETLEIKHTAYSREIFAEGALKAAQFLVSQKEPRMYSMSDLAGTFK